ncbi:hypothetical protein J2Z32_003762 [Paenibacillus turicensis]|uniref:Uncharacterized protein n=1 Tax=Paenibacillus turicensis TaxID=160487 RepID=A0ABS4FWZ7_9BACL|nr:hypothetical protein [Paenibacillus turicensis]MBP1907097.1 hypothetical protein [Paenibacillus turicensis]
MHQQAVETFIDKDGIKVTRTHLKRRINQFYTDVDGDTVYALYEDIDGDIHYRYINFDTDKYKISAGRFESEFTRLEE